jgi:hypothetical protein
VQFKNAGPLLALILACSPKPESASKAPDSTSTTTSPQASAAPATNAPSSTCDSKVIGKYSDLKVSSATGDVGGVEINLQCTSGVYSATVIVAEGVPADPVPASAEVHDTTVRLVFPPDSPLSGMERFDGVVTRGRLVGRFANDVDASLPKRP